MRATLFSVALMLALAAALFGSLPVTAAPAASDPYPGNYCASCHAAGDSRVAHVLDWTGGIESAATGPCLAARQVRDEVYYTERLLLATQRARAGVRGASAGLDKQLAAAQDGYSRLLDTPVTNLDAFKAEGQTLRFRLNKVYAQLNAAQEAARFQRAALVALLVTLALLAALVWGLRNTVRFGPRMARLTRPGWLSALVFVAAAAIFALPIFRPVLPPETSRSAEQMAQLNALDTAGRVAGVADQALVRAWLLARTGAAWHVVDAQQADNALAAAKTAAAAAAGLDQALWGEAQAAREATIGAPANLAKAELAAERLGSLRHRAWAWTLIGADWAPVDRARALEALDQAATTARQQEGYYRDLDLRLLAVTWAGLDPQQGTALAGEIQDPGLRAWALIEIAALTGDKSLYSAAAEAARRAATAGEQVRLLAEVGAAAGDPALLVEARSAATAGLQGSELAYALAGIAAAAGDVDGADAIDPGYHEARGLAYHRLGLYDDAWREAGLIPDPWARARAQSAIARAAGRADLAGQMQNVTLRDRALRTIAEQTDPKLAGNIATPYYRVTALTALGQYPAAEAAAADLLDAYPLRQLGIAWAGSDPATALALVDRLDREADRAAVLAAVAAATGKEDVFRRSLDMAHAARIRGDVAAPVRAALDLARYVLPLDQERAGAAFAQAYDDAQKISTRYK